MDAGVKQKNTARSGKHSQLGQCFKFYLNRKPRKHIKTQTWIWYCYKCAGK